MALSGASKELKPLFDEIRKNGFKIVPAGKHHKIVDVEGKLGAKGKVITDANGPLIVSSTPGDFRARDMHVKRLKDRGIITRDPWKPDKGEAKSERGRGNLQSPENRERARAANDAESKRRKERTDQVRARIEPIIAKLGGWDKRGTTAEFSHAALWFLKKNNRVEAWASPDAAVQNARQLRLGNTLSDKAVDAWNLFADELERHWRRGPGTTPNDEAMREAYFEMVREAKGLPARERSQPKQEAAVALPHRSTPPKPLREPDAAGGGDTPEPAPERVSATRMRPGAAIAPINGNGGRFTRSGLMGETIPYLALEAMYLMARSDSDGTNKDKALEVAEEILAMELARIGERGE